MLGQIELAMSVFGCLRRKVKDKQTGKDVVLSDEQISTLMNVRRGSLPDYWLQSISGLSLCSFYFHQRHMTLLRCCYLFCQRWRVTSSKTTQLQPFVDFVSGETEIHPISNRPEDKRSFLPSVHEQRMVGRMVHAIKMGWAKPRKPKASEDELQKARFYDLWSADDGGETSKTKSQLARIKMYFPAPKVALPGHEESYNPPAEYLPTEQQRQKWLVGYR